MNHFQSGVRWSRSSCFPTLNQLTTSLPCSASLDNEIYGKLKSAPDHIER